MKVSYESQGKPLLTIADAIAAGSYFEDPGRQPIEVGDAKGQPPFKYIQRSLQGREGVQIIENENGFVLLKIFFALLLQ